MNKAEELLEKILKELGAPFGRLIYTGKAPQFITYQLINGGENDFSDDEPGSEKALFRIDIYSVGGYRDLLKRLKKALRQAGFYDFSFGPELYESDTKLFHLPINVKFLEVLSCI